MAERILNYQKYAELRDKKGVSDYKVANDLDMPNSTFSDWASGRSEPKLSKILRIANYFGVPIEDLIK